MKASDRSAFTLTLLLDGEALVVGGETANTTAELYNPKSHAFAYTGNTRVPRQEQGVALLPSGRVLVAGGSGTAGDSAELYDPTSGTFTMTGKMNFARDTPTATLLPDGKVLVAGGNLPPASAQTELYDPDTGQFSLTGTMSVVRYFSSAHLLQNGNVLVVGGQTFSGQSIRTAEIYDSATGMFLPPIEMTSDHVGGSSTQLLDGRVLIAGGGIDGIASFSDPSSPFSDLFEPQNEIFEPGPLMTTARGGPKASLLANGEVLVAGGLQSTGGGSVEFLRSAELYDPVHNSFIPTGDSLFDVWGTDAASVALSNGQVLIAGGGGFPSEEAELYTPPSTPVIKIVSPLNYSVALLGYPRIIYTEIGTKVSWANFYIDGKHLKSSPPFQFVWTPATTGAHRVSVIAYDCSNQPIGTDAITVDVKP
jgi:hypothetical protein